MFEMSFYLMTEKVLTDDVSISPSMVTHVDSIMTFSAAIYFHGHIETI